MNYLILLLATHLTSTASTQNVDQVFVDNLKSINIRYSAGYPYAPDVNGRTCYPVDTYMVSANGIKFQRVCNRTPENKEAPAERTGSITMPEILAQSPNFEAAIIALSENLEALEEPSSEDSRMGCDSVIQVEVATQTKVVTLRSKRNNEDLHAILVAFLRSIESLSL